MISGEQCIAQVRQQTDTVLLAFSTGKDALGAWLALRPHFSRIVPYYMYMVPGLEFVEDSLAYYEREFGCHIYRIPHPSLYRWLNEFTFQPPERCRIIEAARFPNADYQDIQSELRRSLGLSDACFVADGVRAADSPIRLVSFRRNGPINHRRQKFSPIWDWRIDRLATELEQGGIKLPVDYRIWGRTFDGLDYRFLAPLKVHFPRDYERVLDWFPLADVELFRREVMA